MKDAIEVHFTHVDETVLYVVAQRPKKTLKLFEKLEDCDDYEAELLWEKIAETTEPYELTDDIERYENAQFGYFYEIGGIEYRLLNNEPIEL